MGFGCNAGKAYYQHPSQHYTSHYCNLLSSGSLENIKHQGFRCWQSAFAKSKSCAAAPMHAEDDDTQLKVAYLFSRSMHGHQSQYVSTRKHPKTVILCTLICVSHYCGRHFYTVRCIARQSCPGLCTCEAHVGQRLPRCQEPGCPRA